MVAKDKAIVSNKMYLKYPKRFFAIAKSLGVNAENEKNYWKAQMGVEHLSDLNTSQWECIFEGLGKKIEEKAKEDGVVFAKDLDEAMDLILEGGE